MTSLSTPERYAIVQKRLIEIVTPPDTDVTTPVPACPGWAVRDVLAHLTGTPADIVNGQMDDAPAETWTARQVAARRDATVAELVAEWQRQIAAIAPVLATPLGLNLLSDVVTHEQDIRGALGIPGQRTTEEMQVAAEFLVSILGRRIVDNGLPTLTVVLDGEPKLLGSGESAGEVRGTAFELLRSITGRRTPEQVRALFVSGDPDSWLDHFFTFGPRETPLVE